MKLPFAKYHGAGNDFVIIDARQVSFTHRGIQKLVNGNGGASSLQQAQPLELRIPQKSVESLFCKRSRGLCKHKLDTAGCKDEDADEASDQFLSHDVYNKDLSLLARLLCRRQEGVGADGLILLCASSIADHKMRIFNADGSEAAMCGNGIRCLFDFIQKRDSTPLSLKIETLSGIISCRQNGKEIAVNLGAPKVLHWPLKLPQGEAFVVDTGVPHAVLFVEDLDAINVAEAGAKIRFSPHFAPHGVNVNFVTVRQGQIVLRTYERGVEAETLSCGTGAAAAAFVVMRKHGWTSPIAASTRCSFDQTPIQYRQDLRFQFHANEHGLTEIEMLGQAVEVFQGSFDLYRNEFETWEFGKAADALKMSSGHF